jgi:hypothetical protein
LAFDLASRLGAIASSAKPVNISTARPCFIFVLLTDESPEN